MSNSVHKKIKILHDIEELEDGVQVEMILKDVPILKNKSIIEEETIFVNEALQRKSRLNYLKGKVNEFDLEGFEESQNNIGAKWFHNDEPSERGFYIENMTNNEKIHTTIGEFSILDRINQKLNVNNSKKPNQANLQESSIKITNESNKFDVKSAYSQTRKMTNKQNEDKNPFEFLKNIDLKGTTKKVKIVDAHEELQVRIKPKIQEIKNLLLLKETIKNSERITENRNTKNESEISHLNFSQNDLEKKGELVDFELLDTIENKYENNQTMQKSNSDLIKIEVNLTNEDEELKQQFNLLPKNVFEENELVDFSKSTKSFIEHMKRRAKIGKPNVKNEVGKHLGELNQPKKEIKIEYKDTSGRILTPKEIYKQISWKFHRTKPKIKKLLKIKNKEKIKRQSERGSGNKIGQMLEIAQNITKKPYMELN